LAITPIKTGAVQSGVKSQATLESSQESGPPAPVHSPHPSQTPKNSPTSVKNSRLDKCTTSIMRMQKRPHLDKTETTPRDVLSCLPLSWFEFGVSELGMGTVDAERGKKAVPASACQPRSRFVSFRLVSCTGKVPCVSIGGLTVRSDRDWRGAGLVVFYEY
jgi:hypothetical protein